MQSAGRVPSTEANGYKMSKVYKKAVVHNIWHFIIHYLKSLAFFKWTKCEMFDTPYFLELLDILALVYILQLIKWQKDTLNRCGGCQEWKSFN